MRVDKSILGSRAIKPRSVVNVGLRNRITGAVKMTERPDVADDEAEKAVPQQLALLKNTKSTKKKK